MCCRLVFPNYATYSTISVYNSRRSNIHYAAVNGQRLTAAGSLCYSANKMSNTVTVLPFGFLSARGAMGCRCCRQAAETTESFYDLLGIPVSGSHEDIKRAYKKLARKYHPDVSPPDRAAEYTQCFIMVQEAYETLSDPECRAVYDRYLARGLHLAFSTRRQFKEELDEKFGWKNHWQEQLLELKKRSMTMTSDDNLSWGARMRRRREGSS